MATTTNFGWTTPNDTDLVKDGAAAIRTLGSAIDTSLVDLKGGTTGQSLTKNSNTDMDFIWATPAAGGGLTLLSTTTLSGATTTISSISTAYKNLFIVIENAYAGGNIDLIVQLNGDTGTNYTYYGIDSINGSLNGRGNLNASDVTMNNFAPSGNQTKNNAMSVIELPRYTTTSGNQFMTANYKARYSAGYSGGTFAASYLKTAAITSISFTAGNNTWTAGSVLIYGEN